MLIDSHAHLQDKDFSGEIDAVIQRAAEAGVQKIVCVGWDLESSRQAVNIARRHKGIYAVAGVHPHDASSLTSEVISKIYELAKDDKVVAIGEIGLDYYRNLSPQDVQKQAFIEQIRIARELHKPIVIHDRDAHQEVYNIVKKEKAGSNGGVMHCFSGHLPLAIDLMKEGFYLSLAGPVTYKNAKKTHEVAARVPMDRLMIETDCPYLTPEPQRGKRNEPAHVKLVAEKLAELRHKTLEEVAYLTSLNTQTVFRIKD
ncbi:TatD family hydrolase [Syntrophomonas palmitatica]|uniref:TatD family hydrolase n=1 Tax=Syntrophomonas palmitatica TaxID=402877 RepID=UPI0006D0DD90|nr:TatD family hydrolase [Syntrophomonas palmitatica]